jgi:hypothetical protein
MAIYRTTTVWTGFSGAPGYTNFYFQGTGDGDSAANVITKTRAFWTKIAPRMPSVVKMRVDDEVARIDEVTGIVETFLSGVGGAEFAGGQSGGFSSATGACITWQTGAVRNGRRVRGRTFIVPLNGNNYDVDGTIAGGTLVDLNAAAAILADPGSPNLVVWSRPSVKGGSDGAAHFVQAWRVVDKAAVLRSRRD